MHSAILITESGTYQIASPFKSVQVLSATQVYEAVFPVITILLNSFPASMHMINPAIAAITYLVS